MNFRYTSQGDDKPTEASFQTLKNDEIVSYDYLYIQINFNWWYKKKSDGHEIIKPIYHAKMYIFKD